MKFSRFFIERPRSAAVLSMLILIVGLIAYFKLPIQQYPEVVPPTITVTAHYPGATPQVIADTVATPIEQEINGVEGMLYMTSQSTTDGAMLLTITFDLGIDLDTALVQVQSRVAIAEPRLPEEVRRLGVVTRKTVTDIMMVVHLESPDARFNNLYISNYGLLHVKDVLARIKGVGFVEIFGAGEYSMRVWLDPQRLESLSLTAGDVVRAVRAQNIEVPSGTLSQPPTTGDSAYQFTVKVKGRLSEAEEFENVIVKTGENGRLVRVKDVARVELGESDYSLKSYLDKRPAVALLVYQQPATNALNAAAEVERTMDDLKREFPEGLDYRIDYNPTRYIAQSVNAVYFTILEAMLLVMLVIVVFLQSWRAAIIPIIAIPVSLIGTFAVMYALGFSLNSLSLFGLVLAIGIVVDDAIVVVENIERKLSEGLSAHEAASVTMDEVGRALIAIALVLSAVFIPTAFLGGISGEFFRQFAVTIAASTIISAINSLTLSPALGAILLKPRHSEAGHGSSSWLSPVYGLFNRAYNALARWYGRVIERVVARPRLWMVIFVALMVATIASFQLVPRGFIPLQDRGFVVVIADLPPGAALARTDAVMREALDIIHATSGIAHSIAFSGFSGATYTNASNAGAIFVTLKDFGERDSGETVAALAAELQASLGKIQDSAFYVIEPTPVRGLGILGGFKLMLQDRQGLGPEALNAATTELLIAANRESKVVQRVFSTFSQDTPQYELKIDRAKAEMLNLPVEEIFEALQVFLGSTYVNDFNLAGRSFRVRAQADEAFRLDTDDIGKLRARSETGAMVPLASVLEVVPTTGPDRVVRHNLYPTAEILGGSAPGYSSGDAIAEMETLASKLPLGIGHEWTDIAFQEKIAGNIGLLIFPLSVLFVFFVLTAQYESLTLPLAIILIVPLCLLFAIVGIWLRGLENSILTQIAFMVLVGLASKNAILIVEFARQAQNAGKNRVEAAIEAAKLRLRPILMTSAAFIMGVIPLMLAQGAGAEMRQALGTAVFGGMLGVTLFGLLLTPVFYVAIRALTERDADEPGSK